MGTRTTDTDRGGAPPRSVVALWGPPAVLVALYLAGALPLIVSGNSNGRGATDAINFHLLAVRTFAAELPRPDLGAYPVTTTPLYHLVLAAVVRLAGSSAMVLQLFSALFTVGLLATLGRWSAGRVSPGLAVAFGLPVVTSSYVFQSGVWTLPDNAGWWGVLGILLIALDRRPSRRELLLGAGVLVALVLVRQIHIWSAALLWTAAWIGHEEAQRGRWVSLLAVPGPRLRRAGIEVLATLPAFAAIGVFVGLWGGLTPPMFQGMYGGPGWSAPALILALMGGFSPFFAGSWLPGAARLWREHRLVLLGAAAAGLLIGVVPETTFDTHGGRFSGLWNYAERFGVIAGHTSVLIAALSCLGGLCLACWTSAAGFRDRWVTLAAFAAFGAAQCASPMVWQRYNEPFVLLVCAVLACRVVREPGDLPPAAARPLAIARGLGPGVLAVLSAAFTAMVIAGSTPAKVWTLDPKARALPPFPEDDTGR